MRELDELLKQVPQELWECIYIEVNYELAEYIIKDFEYNAKKYKLIDEKREFPLYYRGVGIIRNKMASREGDIKLYESKNKILKVYQYEINKVKQFMRQYELLCNKYEIGIGGCGCCDSPYILDFFTFSVGNIYYDKENKRVKYNIDLDYDYKWLKEYEN